MLSQLSYRGPAGGELSSNGDASWANFCSDIKEQCLKSQGNAAIAIESACKAVPDVVRDRPDVHDLIAESCCQCLPRVDWIVRGGACGHRLWSACLSNGTEAGLDFNLSSLPWTSGLFEVFIQEYLWSLSYIHWCLRESS